MKLLAAAALAACVSSPALAEPYVALGALATVPLNTDQDSIEARNAVSPGLDLGVGTRVTDWVRGDVRLAWRQAHIHGYGSQSADGDINTISLALGGYLNAPTASPLSWLYIGGGIGPALEMIDGSNGSRDGRKRQGTNLEFGYELRAGVRVPAGPVILDLGYGYFATTGHIEMHGPRLALGVPLR